jgi:uncharacterized protein YbcC (UPF0753/DUF2309 family)
LAYECWALEANSTYFEKWKSELEKQLVPFSQSSTELDHNFLLLSLWQRANEWSYQKKIAKKLVGTAKPHIVENPIAQMVFCIDVRSEVIRRKIEEESDNITTHGFAGFFGVSLDCSHNQKDSISYRCPVLLTPKIKLHEDSSPDDRAKKQGVRSFAMFLSGLKQGLVSSFAYIEFFGAIAGFRILERAFNGGKSVKSLFRKKFDDSSQINLEADFDSQVATAEFALTHLGIKKFAPAVFICGHGSVTTNNAFASSLDCGACGGHSGELNARVLCRILNTKKVRNELKQRGRFVIPDETCFVPAIHETVTDSLIVLEEKTLPTSTQEIVGKVKLSVAKAAMEAQKERAQVSDGVFAEGEQRVTNWSEVRPEWALVKNACFVVAPRSRTQRTSLQGRSFLHDYDFTNDEGMKTLELIMTAPMVVTNCINMQYYASSVAMKTFGSGNKVLHNIVGRIGVTEGNSGDLRIGLPLQSVHSGNQLVHDPLRLSVFIEAPEAEIEKIIAKHAVVQQLVDNQWLHIFVIDGKNNKVSYRNPGGSYEAVA